MKNLTKLFLTLSICLFTLGAMGCGSNEKTESKATDPNAPIKIGVTAGPHAEIMDNVKKLAAQQGLQVDVVEFSDFVSPNVSLNEGELTVHSKGRIRNSNFTSFSTEYIARFLQ